MLSLNFLVAQSIIIKIQKINRKIAKANIAITNKITRMVIPMPSPINDVNGSAMINH